MKAIGMNGGMYTQWCSGYYAVLGVEHRAIVSIVNIIVFDVIVKRI